MQLAKDSWNLNINFLFQTALKHATLITVILDEGFAMLSGERSFVTEETLDQGLPDQNLANRKTLEAINQKITKGERACLLVGRLAKETLPPVLEGSKDSWVSGNIIPPEASTLQNRLHIWGDFSNDSFLLPFNGLFSSVCVDMSTWKFFVDDHTSDPAWRFSKLLKQDSSSTFIFEASEIAHRCTEEMDPIYTPYTYEIPKSWKHSPLKEDLEQKVKALSEEQRTKAYQEVALYMTQRDGLRMEIKCTPLSRPKLGQIK
jgi:hypothetical protein